MAELSITDAKNYLKVDFTDDDNLITALMGAADGYLKGSIGETYDNTDERAKALLLIVIADLYDNRGISDKASANVRRLVDDFALQLRLGLRV